MFLNCYHQATRRIFHGRLGKKSPFGHAFGGAADYSGLRAKKRQPPVHLLFRLNTADPALGVTLTGAQSLRSRSQASWRRRGAPGKALPGAQWLPLLCAIRYGACNLGYRVVSEGKVKILYQSEVRPWDGFPYADYPEKLPTKPVAFEEGTYDPDDVEDVLACAGVFGYGALSPSQYAKLIRHVKKEGLPRLFGCPSAEDYLEGNTWPFLQGPPDDECPDPACPNHGRKSSLRTFAIFWDAWDHRKEVRKEMQALWGPDCESLQIIYQVCPLCAAIRTTNQTT